MKHDNVSKSCIRMYGVNELRRTAQPADITAMLSFILRLDYYFSLLAENLLERK